VKSYPSSDQFRSILEVCEELGIELEPSGTFWWVGHCPRPEHNDSTPSFRVNEPGGFFCCMGCGEGGDVAHLYAFVTGCTLAEAVTATVLRDADGLDALPLSLEVEVPHDDVMSGVLSLQRIIVNRVRDLDEDLDVDKWAAALYNAKDEAELLVLLREVAQQREETSRV